MLGDLEPGVILWPRRAEMTRIRPKRLLPA
jgi:hypothetical protein